MYVKDLIMKKIILSLLTFSLLCCNSNDDSQKEAIELVGKWQLIEQLADPGDGSGIFVEINSDRIFEFFNDGTVIVNGDLCYMSSEVSNQNSRNYIELIDNEYYDGEIIPNDCVLSEEERVLYLIEGNNLILIYPCIEGCGQKFSKI